MQVSSTGMCADCNRRRRLIGDVCKWCKLENEQPPTMAFVIRYCTLIAQMRFRRRFEILVQSEKNAKIRRYPEYRQADSEKLPVSPMFNKRVLFDWDEFV